MEGSKSNSNNYRNGGVTSGTFFINESSLSQLNQPNAQYLQQQQQNQKSFSRSSVSPSNSQYSKVSKQDYDSSKKQVRGSVSSDNQQDQDEIMRNTVHKVEIDSEGIVQEKTYKQVLEQKNQRESKLKEMYSNKNLNLIKVEENYNENSDRRSGQNTKSSNREKSDNNRLTIKEQQLNYSYVSFDDNGENFMTNQTDEQSEFNTKQSNANNCNKNRFSSVSSSSTAIYQKKIDEISSELKEKISFLIALEEELLETKTQLNMQKLENSSHKERINKLQKDNQLMQKQITQLGETIKNLEKASNSLVNQILFIKNTHESSTSKDHQGSVSNLDGISPFATYHEYLNDIVKSNINLRCNLEELNQKYSQLKNQINSSVFTHSSPISTRMQNPLLESTLNTNKHRNNFLRGVQENNLDSLSPSNISEVSRRSQSPIQGGMNIEDYEKNLGQSRQFAQYGLMGRVREIKEATDKFVNKYLKNKRRNCIDEQERQFYVEMDNEFQLINSNMQKMEQYLDEIKFENELRVKNAREQFETTLKEIESIKKIAEERNKLLIDQVKSIEQENIHLNKTVENYKGSLMENEKGLDESRLKIETFQKTAEDYQNMLKQVNETLATKNEEVIQLKLYRDNIEKDLNEKVQQIKELKLENSENNQFIRKLQESIIALQKDAQEKQDAFTKALECAQQLKEDSDKRIQMIQQDTYQIQSREKEYLEKEIRLKEKENQLLSELSQRDQIISNLQEQINEINSSNQLNKTESENKSLKSELDNLRQIKKEFESNFTTLQNQILTLKSENKELKNNEQNQIEQKILMNILEFKDDTERKLQHYEKYQQIEQKLGLQQADVLLLIEKLPLAEQELQNIVKLNEKLSKELESVSKNKNDNEKHSKEWKTKHDKANQEMKHLQEQFNSEREMLKDNIKQQIQMNQQLQKQNQTIMQNCEVTKSGYANLECQIKNLTGENELLSQKCSKLEDCLQLLVKERELIKKQSNDNKLKELTSSQQNVIQQLNTNQRDSQGQKSNTDTKRDQLKINTSKDCIITEQSQHSVSPNSRNSKQSSKMSNKPLLSSQQSNGNLNSINASNVQKQSSQHLNSSQSNLHKSKQTQNLTNSIQSQQSGRHHSNSSKNISQSQQQQQSVVSSQQIKQMQQYHAMQGIQQQQLASLSPMSQKKYSQAHQSVQSNASGKNLLQSQQSISPKSIQRQNEQQSKQLDRSRHITEKENNGIQQEQSIKISQLIQNSNQFSNSNSSNNNIIQSLNANTGSSRNIGSQQNIVVSQNIRSSNYSSKCGYSKENSSRIIKSNNNFNQNNQINIEDKQQRAFAQDNDNTFSIEESQSQFTNRGAEKTQSQQDGFKITSEEGYSNTMYAANYYEDSNNQQWKIKSLRDHPYEIVKKNDKNVNQTFAEADQYEDFEERKDFDQFQQQERFEREIQLREQEQRDLYGQQQNEIRQQQQNQQDHNLRQNLDSNNSDQQMMDNQYGFQDGQVLGDMSDGKGNNQQYQNQQYQMSQIHEGFSFNNELQKGKFQFQQQLNNINFSDEAFQTHQTEQYSFN